MESRQNYLPTASSSSRSGREGLGREINDTKDVDMSPTTSTTTTNNPASDGRGETAGEAVLRKSKAESRKLLRGKRRTARRPAGTKKNIVRRFMEVWPELDYRASDESAGPGGWAQRRGRKRVKRSSIRSDCSSQQEGKPLRRAKKSSTSQIPRPRSRGRLMGIRLAKIARRLDFQFQNISLRSEDDR